VSGARARRLLPRSLIGQIALVMAAALLIAQAINFSLILTERQRFSLAQVEGPAIARFIGNAQRFAALDPEDQTRLLGAFPRRGRFDIGPESLVPPGASVARIEERLREAAAANGLPILEARAMVSDRLVPTRRRGPRGGGGGGDGAATGLPSDRLQTLILSVRLPDGRWINGRIVTPRPDPWLAARLAGATLLLYLIVLAAMVWLARRLARPLEELTEAARRFEGRGEAPVVRARGPADVQRAIEAFNAMGGRVSAMLDEKDRMLGAIGHDLRTPLASLRIRAESVEPEDERQRMIATIEEMTQMLDDTLALARSGRTREPSRIVDICALADTVVEEFRDLGHDVEMDSQARAVARVRPNLLRRAVRNLIENGVKYAGVVRVSVRPLGARVAIDVTDRGPGIPEEELDQVQEPFYRLEASRNRETGGTGLGLTLARAAAQAHGGELRLENAPGGGLVARILLPTGSEAAAAS
jgi:signal transduction histidine kinase